MVGAGEREAVVLPESVAWCGRPLPDGEKVYILWNADRTAGLAVRNRALADEMGEYSVEAEYPAFAESFLYEFGHDTLSVDSIEIPTDFQTGEERVQYRSTKTYGHEVGLSCCFRQHRADSHCRFLHGYALAVKLVFVATELDERNWVVDFGSLKGFKGWLEGTFDHKTLVAYDDPERGWFAEAARRGLIQLVEVEATGCEAFARLIYECAEVWLKDNGYAPRVRIESVEVREHGANSAIATDDIGEMPLGIF